MSSDPPSFQTAEDEINFILGNIDDDGDLGGGALFEELAGLTAEAAAHNGPVGADVVADFATGFGAASNTQGGPSKQPLARKVSLSPQARVLPTTDGAALEPLAFQDALPNLSAQDFEDFDLADEDTLLFPSGMSDGPSSASSPARGIHNEPFQPSSVDDGFGTLFNQSEATFGRLGLFHRFLPSQAPTSDQTTTAAFEHMAPLIHTPVTPTSKKKPPLVHVPPSYAQSKRPLKKRQVQSISPCLMEPDATMLFARTVEKARKVAAAREARTLRRVKRAKGQAVNLIGGGDESEIQKQAVADSLRAVSDEEEALLAEFAANFDPAVFVRSNLNQVYEALSEASEAQEKKVLEAASKEAVATDFALDSPTVEPLQLLPAVSLEEEDVPATTPAVVTPKISKINTEPPAMAPPTPNNKPVNDKVLPTGKDPESRRLRRLMRNRLSAQASRDRRKKAIEEVKNKKAQKDEEIRSLQQAVENETRRLQLLQKAMGMARERLQARGCSKEADALSLHGTRASTKTRC